MEIFKKDMLFQAQFFFSCLIYAFSLNYAHKTYLLETQEFWGYSYYGLDLFKILFIFIFIFISSFIVSLRLDTPSKIISYTLYIVVFIPTIVLTLALREDSLHVYGFNLFCLVIGFFIINLKKINSSKESYVIPHKKFELFLILLFFMCFFTLTWVFKDVINFVGLEDVYTQRSLGRSRSIFDAYMLTYLPNVICTALMSYGLIKKNKLYIIFSICGYFLIYGITAQRTVFLMPFILYGLYIYLKDRDFKKQIIIKFNYCISFIFIMISIMPPSLMRDFFGFYFLTRIFATPGIMFSLYHDVFDYEKYTYWSHVKGISFFIDRPIAFQNENEWPQLGWIVAKYRLGITSNSNANLFAADGLAAAGGIGIIVICILFYMYLYILDYLTKNINPIFKVMIAFPIGLALTNGSLATILLSFGGIFWLIVFIFVKAKKN